MPKTMAGFELSLAASGLSARTIYTILSRCRILERETHFNQDLVTRFLLEKHKSSAASVNKYIQALRHYTKYAGLTLEIPHQFREHAKIRPTFTDREIEQILGVRENVYTSFLGILAYSGCRPGELLGMTQEHIDYQRRVISLPVTKTHSDRLVPLPQICIPYLSNIPFHFSDTAARDELRKRCKLLSLSPRPLYAFRHSYATRLLDSDVNLLDVMSLMGHGSADVTKIYYHTSVTRLQKAIRRDTLVRSSMTPEEKLATIQRLLEELRDSFKLEEDTDLEFELRESPDEVKLVVKKKTTS